jgi:hypothetical protein
MKPRYTNDLTEAPWRGVFGATGWYGVTIFDITPEELADPDVGAASAYKIEPLMGFAWVRATIEEDGVIASQWDTLVGLTPECPPNYDGGDGPGAEEYDEYVHESKLTEEYRSSLILRALRNGEKLAAERALRAEGPTKEGEGE